MENYNFIEVYDNSIPDYLVDNFINYFNSNSQLTTRGEVGGKSGNVIDIDIKDSFDLCAENIPLELSREYEMHLQNSLNSYMKKYEYVEHSVAFRIREEYQMQYYKPGGGFKVWHSEITSNPRPEFGLRHIVFMTYLNTLDDGGTEFYYQNLKVNAIKGRTVIWPPTWTHTHRGVISNTQEKYILTGWFNFVE